MARYKRESKGKKINPSYRVFCEGESEEAYIYYLRNKYRLPVEIIPKITMNKVSARVINRHINLSPKHDKDKVFLMYDIDVEGFLDKLKIIQKEVKAELLVSNPCFELWYLLHFTNQTAEINSDTCIKKLENICHDYTKGVLSIKLKEKLEEKKAEATKRAKGLNQFDNPSTNIYQIIDELESLKN